MIRTANSFSICVGKNYLLSSSFVYLALTRHKDEEGYWSCKAYNTTSGKPTQLEIRREKN